MHVPLYEPRRTFMPLSRKVIVSVAV